MNSLHFLRSYFFYLIFCNKFWKCCLYLSAVLCTVLTIVNRFAVDFLAVVVTLNFFSRFTFNWFRVKVHSDSSTSIQCAFHHQQRKFIQKHFGFCLNFFRPFILTLQLFYIHIYMFNYFKRFFNHNWFEMKEWKEWRGRKKSRAKCFKL